ncbi:unnamed protein product [Chondrus crispus]|uniref:Uncharacterized protein n=1 Tax=Chondrus crispus TaxID=2769 RepID=R7QL21_CHOCR|nr:unnamed protein product [Chondrus crispus]CDF38085.1 unnamed protein product [Chondrus crispus]|eukprot:XP_005717954.1 unnamed protein product [Chondrus crispus]
MTDSPPSDTCSHNGVDSELLFNYYDIRNGKVTALPRAKSDRVEIKSLSDLGFDIFTYANLPTHHKNVMEDSAGIWTQFFLSNNITLRGPYDCANMLKSNTASDPIVITADVPFMYYNTEKELTPRGERKGLINNTPITLVHLTQDKRRTRLHKNLFYAIGSEFDMFNADVSICCKACSQVHDIRNTPCRLVTRFMTTDGALRERVKRATGYGERILHISDKWESSLHSVNHSDNAYLCSECEERAVERGDMWYEMSGSCSTEGCANAVRQNEMTTHDGSLRLLFFISEWERNNLPDDGIAKGIKDGRIQVIKGVEAGLSENGCRWSEEIERVAKKSCSTDEIVTMKRIVMQCPGLSQDELLALAMQNSRLGGWLEGRKGVIQRKSEGFIKCDKHFEVGPWIEGRIAYDRRGVAWDVVQEKPVFVTTRNKISHIADTGGEEVAGSDALGEFIA